MPSDHPTLAIIGAGRVGRALGRALHQQGWHIGAVVTRSRKTARAAVRAIGAGQPRARLDATALAANVVLITTPDRAIATVARQLARLDGHNRWQSKIVLHSNGALDRSVLAPLEKLGAATGSLHPLQTFSGHHAPELDGCICAIEGRPLALRVARRIARDLGCIPVTIAPQAKPAYHAAAALAAGHSLAITEAATRILISLGFKRKEAVRALLPLTRQTLANFERFGATAAWTGPLARGDFATVKKHAAALRKFPREYSAVYDALSRLAVLVLGKRGKK